MPPRAQGRARQACGAVILSLARMAAMDAPDLASGTITVQAGAVLASLHAALEDTGLMFPLHLAAEGSAQIGGLTGTNARGSHAFRSGMMADLVLGLEVVLPDGTIWNGLRAVQKDNAGYALRKLFCGSEGTLGVVTRAVMALWQRRVAWKAARQFALCSLRLAWLALHRASSIPLRNGGKGDLIAPALLVKE